jgi:hypothetical protein
VSVPPGAVLDLGLALNGAWEPVTTTPEYKLWMLHADIPDGVIAESRDEFYGINYCINLMQPHSLGKVSILYSAH